ncbi:hypothetical protein ABT150_23615 [Streptomyces mirabilis]|uniref:hypothetical protein n=1 Tax=Streptomyces mirabilis TaxID=68239 RepID=UPI00332F7BDF
MKAVWTLFTLPFGVATLGAIGNAIQSLKNSGASGSRNSYSMSTGILDGFLQVLFIALLALATRACYRRAARDRQPSMPDANADRKPWER